MFTRMAIAVKMGQLVLHVLFTYIIYISFLVNCPTPMALRLANEERVRWTLIYANGNQSQGELR